MPDITMNILDNRYDCLAEAADHDNLTVEYIYCVRDQN